MWRIAALAGVVTFGAAYELQLDRAEAAVFHHLHLGSLGAGHLANIYARLFVPGSIVRGVFWGVEGIEGRRFHLLVSGATVQRSPDAPTALWHFGWGTVSLGESYADHYRREVNWRPPYASLEADFHVHLRSADPRQAAGWYEQALGASVDRLAGAPSTIDAVAAIVRVDGVSLAIHGMPARGTPRLDSGGRHGRPPRIPGPRPVVGEGGSR